MMKLKTLRVLAWSMVLLIVAASTQAQGVIVNEFSNGPAGNQEFIELVVVGPDLNPNCGPVDLTGWIVDDNNGDFSCGPCASTGIAPGHIRFGATGVWAAVPTGSIIVIYDPATKNPRVPADDPNDTAPTDGVYILSSADPSIEVATTPCGMSLSPNGVGACTTACTGNSGYAGSCYTAGVVNSSTGLRNLGDAAQTRNPGGAYYHGIGFGTAGSLINGGPDNIFMSGDGSGRYYAFANTTDNNFRSGGNFVFGTVASLGETPGLANSANNATWIASLGEPCLLSVNYYQPLSVKAGNGINFLEWATASEINSDHWDVMRSYSPADGFTKIGEVQASGNVRNMRTYSFADIDPEQPKVYYQLLQYDADGSYQQSNIVQVLNHTLESTYLVVWPNPSSGELQLQAAMEGMQSLHLVDMMGREVYHQDLDAAINHFEMKLDLSALRAGNYFLQLRGSHGPITKRVTLQ
jgi:hypothetical protein